MKSEFSYGDYLKYLCNDNFLIPELKAEIPLYRYRGNIDHVVDEITNDHIYMSPLEKLNDPFDSSCALTYEDACQYVDTLKNFHLQSYFLHKRAWYGDFDDYIKTLPNDNITLEEYSRIVSKFAREKGDNIGAQAVNRVYYQRCFSRPIKKHVLGTVASFSETWESIPMWSYYANSHKGVCLKYDFDLLNKNEDSFNRITASLHKVWYSEKRFKDSKGVFTPFVKSLQWAHEQEWRLFRESQDEYLSIPCLSEIYLGLNFDCDNLDRIVEAVKNNARDIKVYILQPKPQTYGFERVSLYI